MPEILEFVIRSRNESRPGLLQAERDLRSMNATGRTVGMQLGESLGKGPEQGLARAGRASATFRRQIQQDSRDVIQLIGNQFGIALPREVEKGMANAVARFPAIGRAAGAALAGAIAGVIVVQVAQAIQEIGFMWDRFRERLQTGDTAWTAYIGAGALARAKALQEENTARAKLGQNLEEMRLRAGIKIPLLQSQALRRLQLERELAPLAGAALTDPLLAARLREMRRLFEAQAAQERGPLAVFQVPRRRPTLRRPGEFSVEHIAPPQVELPEFTEVPDVLIRLQEAMMAPAERLMKAAGVIFEAAERFREGVRDAAKNIFDALLTGGKLGVVNALKGLALIPLRQIFANLAAVLFGRLEGKVPRAKGGTILGDILQGTIFGPKAPEVVNAEKLLATAQTATIVAGTVIMSGGVGAGTSGTSPFLMNAFGRGGFTPALYAALSTAGLALGGKFGGKTGVTIAAAGTGAIAGAQALKGNPTAGAFIGAGIMGGGAMLVQPGGTGQHVAGGAIAGASIGMLVGGPMGAAIGAAIGAGVGLQRSFIGPGGPSPMERQRQIERILEANRFSFPDPLNPAFALGGGGVDYGFGEMPRAIPRITIQVQTMDARSFRENAGMIAGAVRHAMIAGMSPLNQDLRGAL